MKARELSTRKKPLSIALYLITGSSATWRSNTANMFHAGKPVLADGSETDGFGWTPTPEVAVDILLALAPMAKLPLMAQWSIHLCNPQRTGGPNETMEYAHVGQSLVADEMWD